MIRSTSNRSSTSWDLSVFPLQNYQRYLSKPENKFNLTLIDLFYIVNFKGGNATINEEEDSINLKLRSYSIILLKINQEFPNPVLTSLTQSDLEKVKIFPERFFELARDVKTEIKGFKYSFLSALLHAYFPDLFPILDRRLLLNLGIVSEEKKANINSDGQIKNIDRFYPRLIEDVCNECNRLNKSIREIDEYYFKQELPQWYWEHLKEIANPKKHNKHHL